MRLVLVCIRRSLLLRVNAVQRPREGDGFADMVQAAVPGHQVFNIHAEAPKRVR
jgi:hypothetical protein